MKKYFLLFFGVTIIFSLNGQYKDDENSSIAINAGFGLTGSLYLSNNINLNSKITALHSANISILKSNQEKLYSFGVEFAYLNALDFNASREKLGRVYQINYISFFRFNGTNKGTGYGLFHKIGTSFQRYKWENDNDIYEAKGNFGINNHLGIGLLACEYDYDYCLYFYFSIFNYNQFFSEQKVNEIKITSKNGFANYSGISFSIGIGLSEKLNW